jgi:hypothetical protein
MSTIAAAASSSAPSTSSSQSTARKHFVLEVVRSAVALPQPDPQDRLRVLQSAATVIAPFDAASARRFAREGAHLEAEIIASGQTPAVSVLSGGHVDCATAKEFVESVPASAVQGAEDSLVSAMTLCKQAQDPARAKVESALDNGVVASRALLALMESAGANSAWSQAEFKKMFASLPGDAVKQAPDFAAMFARMAPAVDKDAARDAGLKFLDWLCKQKAGGERNLSITLATDALRSALGEEGYTDALQSDPVAMSVAQTVGQPGEIEHPAEDTVSVLKAMDAKGEDHTDALRAMPAAHRAREAAADGFAAGTSGDRKRAERYFDIAYSAVDEVWSARAKTNDASAVVEEVSEAAAHVDAVAALRRSQALEDPSAQAISMIAVARVVVGQQ